MNGSRTNISLKIWAQQEPERDSLWLALGWQPLPISEKPLFHGVSLREGLNWLLEEARTNKEGSFRPTCGCVFDNHPGIGGITIPFVLTCWGPPALVWFAPAIATAHCQIPAKLFLSLQTQSLSSALIPFSSKLGPFFPIHRLLWHCFRPPWHPVAQFCHLVPKLTVFHLGRRKSALSLTQHLSGTSPPWSWGNVSVVNRAVFFLT